MKTEANIQSVMGFIRGCTAGKLDEVFDYMASSLNLTGLQAWKTYTTAVQRLF
jgi:hypothetical protein